MNIGKWRSVIYLGGLFLLGLFSLSGQVRETAVGATADPSGEFADTVKPFLEQYCQTCHNRQLQSGEINFEELKLETTSAAKRDTWETTAYVLQMGQMPPRGSPRPPQPKISAVLAVLSRDLASAGGGVKPHLPAIIPTRDWLTWGYDPERTSWARAETSLSMRNVSSLSLLWKAQLDAVPNKINLHATITDPLVVQRVPTKSGPKTLVYIAGGENNVYALDSDNGVVVWERQFPSKIEPSQPASGACPNNLNATPVIDRQSGILYFLSNDGKLRGLALADGEDRMAPSEIVTPYSRNWSLNLIDGIVYTSSSRGCGAAVSSITGMDVRSPNHPVYRFFPSTGKASGPWGRGGVVLSPAGIVAQTADGAYDPAGGRFGNSFVGLARDLRLIDSYTPANEGYLNSKDFDLGSASPVVFDFEKWTLVAGAAKEGAVYLLDSLDLGGAGHRTPLYLSPRYGNDALLFGFNGVWGSLSTFVDAQGERWVLVPMLGPPAKDTAPSFGITDGPVVNGSIMAFKVKVQDGKPVLVPVWMSHDLDLPGIPVEANGVVYVLATGDRAGDAIRGPRRGPPPGQAPGQRPAIRRVGGPTNQVNAGEPGSDRDAAWLASQAGPDGQKPGRRFSGGLDTTHTVLYALDATTGKQIYSSKELIDSWNHYGGLALSGGRVYLSTYDARVYAFGLLPGVNSQ
jgi:outer membrane protein assembly factor BamB